MLRIWSSRWKPSRIRAVPPSQVFTKPRPARDGFGWQRAIVAIAIAAALVLWWRQPPAVPVVEAVTQLTDDGEPKWIYDNLLTDGSRVYFNEGTNFSLKIAQVAVIGGPTAIIPVRLAAPIIVGLRQEGASLLTLAGAIHRAWSVSFADDTVTHRRSAAPRRYSGSRCKFCARRAHSLLSLGRISSSPKKMARILASCSVQMDRFGDPIFLQTTSSWFSRFWMRLGQFHCGLQPRRFRPARHRGL